MTPGQAVETLAIGDFADHNDRERALAVLRCLARQAEQSGADEATQAVAEMAFDMGVAAAEKAIGDALTRDISLDVVNPLRR